MATNLLYNIQITAKDPATASSEYLERLSLSDITTGWTVSDGVMHSKFVLATGVTADLFPTHLGAPVADYQIIAVFTYTVSGIANQKVSINVDANGAHDERWIFSQSFDTSLTVNNATGADVTVEYIIFDRIA